MVCIPTSIHVDIFLCLRVLLRLRDLGDLDVHHCHLEDCICNVSTICGVKILGYAPERVLEVCHIIVASAVERITRIIFVFASKFTGLGVTRHCIIMALLGTPPPGSFWTLASSLISLPMMTLLGGDVAKPNG